MWGGMWSCDWGVVISENWECSGDIDQSDPNVEFWVCHWGVMISDQWECSGDIDKSDSFDELNLPG